jgi:phosphotriesterase-related protein
MKPVRAPETSKTPLLTRREAVRLVGLGAGWLAVLPKADLAATAHPDQTIGTAAFPRGAVIRTVLKDMRPALVGNSGAIMFHEHLSLTTAGVRKRVPTVPPNEPYFTENTKLMIDEIKAAMKSGLACAVDAGHADIGRDTKQLQAMSRATGLQIVASGGYHTQPTYPSELATLTIDEIAERLVRDARAERWGAFGEIGSEAEMTRDERKVFHAIGKAQVRTNLPIFTHTETGRPALEQLDIFESHGVKPERVMIGHMGVPTDLGVAKAVCGRGAYIGFDQLARLYGRPDQRAAEIKMITAIIDAGFVDHILFGTDLTRKDQITRMGGAGYAGALTEVIPALRKTGVSDAALQRILVENPRRLLAFVPND